MLFKRRWSIDVVCGGSGVRGPMRAEVWLRAAAPAITARLCQPV